MSATAPARWNEKKFHFDPTKPRGPQIAKVVAQVVGLMGGLLLAMVSMFLYPMLLSGTGYAVTSFGPMAIVCVASFFLVPKSWFPPDMPTFVRGQMRLGFGLFGTAWFIAIFGIANGYNTPVVVQDAPIVYKRTSTPNDPKHLGYFVGTRVWPSSRKVYEVQVRRDFYDRLDVPVVKTLNIPWQVTAMPDHGLLRLNVGQGRFGINWLDSVVGEAPPASH